MSSSPIARHDSTARQSTASSSTLASADRYDVATSAVAEPAFARHRRSTPRAGEKRQSRMAAATNGSPDPKRGSIGRSGGFLLASSLKHASTTRPATKHAAEPAQSDVRSRRDNVNAILQASDDSSDNGQARQINGHAQIDRQMRALNGNGAAVSSTHASDAAIMDNHWLPATEGTSSQHTSTIDPAQIVSMALNLSEGRRRHWTGNVASSSLRASPQSIKSSPGSQTQHYSVGGSLKKHLQDQRRISKHLTTKAEVKAHEHHQQFVPTSANGPQVMASLQQHLSVATLSRAEKARNYFELAAQYRRLLSNLPAMPRSTPTSAAVPHQALHNLPTGHANGRRYNPLQTIRNRRTRARQRKALEPKPDLWTDVAAVKDWVNIVENIAHDSTYNNGRQIILPRYPPKQHEYLRTITPDGDQDSAADTRKLARPKLDWSFSPSELLADAYWLEQDEHKLLIEDRHGAHFFQSLPQKEAPRISIESSHREVRNVSSEAEKALDSDFDTGPQQRSRNKIDVSHDNAGRLKQAWHKARRRSMSDSSEMSHSESERRKKPHRNRPQPVDFLSTGPLERYLNSMAAQQSSQPSFVDADDRRVNHESAVAAGQHRSPRPFTADEGVLLDPPAEELTSPDSGRSKHKRPSVHVPHAKSTSDFWSASSPLAKGTDAPLDTGEKHQQDQELSSHGASKHLFPFGRSQAKRGVRMESGSTNAEDSDMSSRRPSEDSKALPQGLNRHERSFRGQGLMLDTRFSGSTNSLISSQSTYLNGKPRDPDSAVRRFFKGSMIGRRREDRKQRRETSDIPEQDPGMTDDTDTDFVQDHDVDEQVGMNGGTTTRARRATKGSGLVSVNGDSRLQYHLNLPTFKSSNLPATSRPTTPDQEHQANPYARSPLRDASTSDADDSRLGGTDVLDMVTTHSTEYQSDVVRQRSRQASRQSDDRSGQTDTRSRLNDMRKSEQAQRLASTANKHDPTPAANEPLSSQQRRHWSITEISSRKRSLMGQEPAGKISFADIARMRTLLICTGIKAAALARRTEGDAQHTTDDSRTPAQVPPRALADRASLAATATKLTSDLAHESALLHTSATAFRNQAVLPLHRSLHALRVGATEHAEHARTAGDEAVGFAALVSGQKTIEVRRVIEQMARFRRRRRRRVRWIRRVAFGLLEWGVLLVMWQVWLVVVVFKALWSIVGALVAVVRWALWL